MAVEIEEVDEAPAPVPTTLEHITEMVFRNGMVVIAYHTRQWLLAALHEPDEWFDVQALSLSNNADRVVYSVRKAEVMLIGVERPFLVDATAEGMTGRKRAPDGGWMN